MGSLSGILVVEPPHDPLGKTHFSARKNPNVWGDCPANQLASPSPRPHYFARPMHFADTQEKCIDREGLGTRRTGTKQKQKPIPAWENSRYYSIAATTGICIRNSMICSDILHKYHEWYFELNSKQNRLLWLNRQVNRKLIWEAMKLREWTKINFLKS